MLQEIAEANDQLAEQASAHKVAELPDHPRGHALHQCEEASSSGLGSDDDVSDADASHGVLSGSRSSTAAQDVPVQSPFSAPGPQGLAPLIIESAAAQTGSKPDSPAMPHVASTAASPGADSKGTGNGRAMAAVVSEAALEAMINGSLPECSSVAAARAADAAEAAAASSVSVPITNGQHRRGKSGDPRNSQGDEETPKFSSCPSVTNGDVFLESLEDAGQLLGTSAPTTSGRAFDDVAGGMTEQTFSASLPLLPASQACLPRAAVRKA